MGICTEIIVDDDLGFQYANTNKEELIKKFLEEIEKIAGYPPELKYDCGNKLIFDMEKIPPDLPQYKEIIFKYFDNCCVYYDDGRIPKVLER